MSERPYSLVLCMSPQNIEIRRRIIQYFTHFLHQDQIDETNLYPPEYQFSQKLSFLIKKVSKSINFSSFIHGTYHKHYEIVGPYVPISSISL